MKNNVVIVRMTRDEAQYFYDKLSDSYFEHSQEKDDLCHRSEEWLERDEFLRKIITKLAYSLKKGDKNEKV